MNLESILNQYAWNLSYAEHLALDVPASLWAQSGGPGLENHPAWTFGHLVTGSALVAADLGAKFELLPGWKDLFERRGPNDPRRPSKDVSLYPTQETSLAELARVHHVVAVAVRERADVGFWNAEDEWRFDGYLPSRLDTLLFMLIAHENVHLGQLGCWRRRFDLPSAMKAMGRGPAFESRDAP